MGQAVLMMFWAPCDSRLIPEQLLMVLIVNKQVTASRSEFCWEMDEQLSAPASQRPVLNHLPTLHYPPSSNRHRWRVWPGLLLQEPATTFYISLSVSKFVSSSVPDSHARNNTYVCLCMATPLCDVLTYFKHTEECINHNTLTTHCLCTYISRILSAPLLPDSQGYVCVVLLRTIPWPTHWDETQKVELKWLSYSSWEQRWEHDGKRERQQEWKWNRGVIPQDG